VDVDVDVVVVDRVATLLDERKNSKGCAMESDGDATG
jgi:hypothetical protein